jgi:amino acid transporter
LSKDNEELKRVIGIPGLAASVVNLTIGAGIFVLPAIIGLQLGAAGIIGYILCALMFTAIILCYVEIGSRVKSSGGSYAYVEKAFGPFAGFVINWLLFFGWGILGDAAIINVVSGSLAALFPVFADPMMRILLMFILIGAMMLINMRDAKLSVRIVKSITIFKVVPLIALIIFGLSHINISNLEIKQLPSLRSFGETALILFFAFAGFETSLNSSGEIKNPQRTIPLGILAGGVLVLIIYMLLQTVTLGVLGTQLNEFKEAPLAAVAEKVAGSAGGVIILIVAALSATGTVTGDVLASSRLLFAGARDGLFPRFMGKVHPKYGTPHWAVTIYASLIFIFSVSGGFKQLAVLASGALLIIYLGVVLSLIKLRLNKKEDGEKTFRVPGGLIIPIIAIVAILYVLSNLSQQEILSLVIFIAAICVIYIIMKGWQNKTRKNPDNPEPVVSISEMMN